jgi:hypothetical protein
MTDTIVFDVFALCNYKCINCLCRKCIHCHKGKLETFPIFFLVHFLSCCNRLKYFKSFKILLFSYSEPEAFLSGGSVELRVSLPLGRVWTNPLLFLPKSIPTHTQWITSFVLDSIHTQSIICTLPTPYPPHFFNG